MYKSSRDRQKKVTVVVAIGGATSNHGRVEIRRNNGNLTSDPFFCIIRMMRISTPIFLMHDHMMNGWKDATLDDDEGDQIDGEKRRL